jgi:hypothetical protein
VNASHEHPVMLELPGIAPTALTEELLARVEAALREHRRRGSSRDLTQEIEAFLRRHPVASTIEIARGIRARDTEVRGVLNGNPIFEPARDSRNREGRGNRWTLATAAGEPVPSPGTGNPRGGSTT